jgi:membrane-associated protease RseP (regulator of RpoE activity)
MPRSRESFAFSIPSMPQMKVFHNSNMLGLELMELNEQLGEYFQAPNAEGVLVTQVEKNSAAAKAGFKAGDVITRVGTKRVDETGDIWRALEKYDEGDKVEVEIIRKGAPMKLSVEIDEDVSSRNFNFWFTPKSRSQKFKEFHFEGFMPDLDELHHEIESNLRPELDKLRIELRTIGKEQQKQMRELRDKIKKEIKLRMAEDEI